MLYNTQHNIICQVYLKKNDEFLASFRSANNTLAESIVGKNPHHVISGPAWVIKHRIVINYIEAYVLENNEIPSGIHFIRKFKGRPNAYPGPIGERGFVNFDNFYQMVLTTVN